MDLNSIFWENPSKRIGQLKSINRLAMFTAMESLIAMTIAASYLATVIKTETWQLIKLNCNYENSLGTDQLPDFA